MSPEEFFKKIDGPLLREQRLWLLSQLEKWNELVKDPDSRTAKAKKNLSIIEGLVGLTDNLADVAHDQFDIDCLLTKEE